MRPGTARGTIAASSTLGEATVALRKLARSLRPFTVAFAVLVLIAALLAAIFLTQLAWEWVIFLSGILTAAVLSLASRSASMEWRMARRAAQLARCRERLTLEQAALRHAEAEAASARSRLELLVDGLPMLYAYLGPEAHIRFANRAFQEWAGLKADQIEHWPLKDILGERNHEALAAALQAALTGETKAVAFRLAPAQGPTRPVTAALLPHRVDDGVEGLFLLVVPAIAEGAAEAPPIAYASEAQELYAETVAEQLTDWEDDGAHLLAALEHDEFTLYCQPIVPVADRGQPPCHEVLIRLREEEEKLLPPGSFLPTAERYGLLPEVDRWVTRHLLAWLQRRAALDPSWRPTPFSINLAGATLADTGFPEFVREAARQRGIAPETLCFEVFEVDMLHDRARAARALAALRGIGCRTALVGFGRNRVSFDLLKAVPVDFVKIDSSIVLAFLRDPVALAKLKAICRVCATLGIRTIAEFVENDEIWQGLQALDVDYAQGFGIGAPRPLDDL